MKYFFRFIIILIITYVLFYLIISFIKWDINLFDEISNYIEARILTLFLIIFGVIITLNTSEIID